MKVLIVASDRNELKFLPDKWDKCVCGVGNILSAAVSVKYAMETGADILVSVGSAGTLGRLEKGDVVSFGTVVTPDQDLTAMHVALGSTIGSDRATFRELHSLDASSPYTLYSSGRFSREILSSHTLLRADAADMEAYGVAVAARILGRGFYAVKLLTDSVGDSSRVQDILFSYREGRERLASFLSSLLS